MHRAGAARPAHRHVRAGARRAARVRRAERPRGAEIRRPRGARAGEPRGRGRRAAPAARGRAGGRGEHVRHLLPRARGRTAQRDRGPRAAAGAGHPRDRHRDRRQAGADDPRPHRLDPRHGTRGRRQGGRPRGRQEGDGMSGQVLTPEAIAALVEAAREGRLPEEKPAPQRRRRMRAVDFTRPNKFTAEQERRLGRTLEAFCRTASTRLSAELRVPLELELLTTTQLTWANAHTQVPSNSMGAIFVVEPIGTRMLMAAESSLILGAIELLLGGTIEGGVKERRMTDIDQALGRHFFERLLGQLTMIWTDVAGVELKLETFDQHLETAQMVSVSEPTMSLMMEARLQGTSAMLALLIPWSAIAPVADAFAAREDMSGAQNAEDATSVRRAVGNVEMTVRAEVAAVQLPIEAVLGLKEGDLLRLNAPASGGITLYADKVPVHVGRPGRAGSRRAVQVTGKAGGER